MTHNEKNILSSQLLRRSKRQRLQELLLALKSRLARPWAPLHNPLGEVTKKSGLPGEVTKSSGLPGEVRGCGEGRASAFF